MTGVENFGVFIREEFHSKITIRYFFGKGFDSKITIQNTLFHLHRRVGMKDDWG